MTIEVSSAAVGGAIGLIGALSGVLLGHFFSSSREAKARKIDGLREVMTQLNMRSRLALQFDQHVNLGLNESSPDEFARKAFQIDGWRAATHELQEQNWKFACMAYLPDAFGDFEGMDHQIAYIMDPYAERPEDPKGRTRDVAREEFFRLQVAIQIRVQERLAELV